MNGALRWWLGVTLLAAMAGAGWVAREQSRERVRLAGAVEDLRGRKRELARLRAEAARLEREQVSAAELERLRADRAAVARMRGELEKLRREVEQRARTTAVETGGEPAAEKRITEELVPAAAWRNRGAATPTDAVESALGAAAGGDVAGFAGLLVFGPGARAKAEALLAELSAVGTEGDRTPEELIALLGAKDVPLGEAQIIEPKKAAGSPAETGDAGVKRLVRLRDSTGSERIVQLALARENSQWRIVVPEAAVVRYAAELRGKAGSVPPMK